MVTPINLINICFPKTYCLLLSYSFPHNAFLFLHLWLHLVVHRIIYLSLLNSINMTILNSGIRVLPSLKSTWFFSAEYLLLASNNNNDCVWTCKDILWTYKHNCASTLFLIIHMGAHYKHVSELSSKKKKILVSNIWGLLFVYNFTNTAFSNCLIFAN